MDANKLRISVILAQDELNQVRAGYAAHYDMARARDAADEAQKIAEGDSLIRIQPGSSERAQARWQGEGGGPADDDPDHPLVSLYPDSARS